MKLDEYLRKGTIKKTEPDVRFFKDSMLIFYKTVNSLKKINMDEDNSHIKYKETYDALRHLLEAIAILKGFKFSTHEAISVFLEEVLDEKIVADKFNDYRRIRNDINYNGKLPSFNLAKDSVHEMESMIKKLKKHLN